MGEGRGVVRRGVVGRGGWWLEKGVKEGGLTCGRARVERSEVARGSPVGSQSRGADGRVVGAVGGGGERWYYAMEGRKVARCR